MHPTNAGTLRVAGATIYYTVRGRGPLLLILQGGAGDAEGSNGIAPYLVDSYTVVSYDRRGLSRSPLDDPTAAPSIGTHAADVHHLLAPLTDEPAYVVGCSFGALVGLELVARHPEQVRTLVAHEAPTTQLLPEPLRTQAVRDQERVEEGYRREGIAAMREFLAITGVDFADREPDIALPPRTEGYAANIAFFLTHDAPAARFHRLDLDALQRAAGRIVPAAGSTDRDFWIHRCARALAERLGRPLEEFPGGHNGYALHPRAFAARLRAVLGG
jgi:pimeloyl-ACP methyl ester carboxylesterase